MPSKSKEQKTVACMALAMRDGKLSKNYSKQAAKMAESMTREQLEDYCKMPIAK